jgi:hypothetical protein
MDASDPQRMTGLTDEHLAFVKQIMAANDDLMERMQALNYQTTYDHEDDYFEVTIGGPTEAETTTLNNTLFLRFDPDTLKLVGFGILGFQEAMKHYPSARTLYVSVVDRLDTVVETVREMVAV